MYYWILWDFFAIIVLTLCIGICASKGFVRTVLWFLGLVIAVLIASKAAPIIAESIYTGFVKEYLEEIVNNKIMQVIADGRAALENNVETMLPSALIGITKLFIGNMPTVETQNNTMEMSRTIVANVVREPVVSIISAICFFILLSILLFIFRHINKLFAPVLNLPVLGTLNTILGAGLGVLFSIVAMLVLANLLYVFATVFASAWLNPTVLDSTYIFHAFL